MEDYKHLVKSMDSQVKNIAILDFVWLMLTLFKTKSLH